MANVSAGVCATDVVWQQQKFLKHPESFGKSHLKTQLQDRKYIHRCSDGWKDWTEKKKIRQKWINSSRRYLLITKESGYFGLTHAAQKHVQQIMCSSVCLNWTEKFYSWLWKGADAPLPSENAICSSFPSLFELPLTTAEITARNYLALSADRLLSFFKTPLGRLTHTLNDPGSIQTLQHKLLTPAFVFCGRRK